MTPYNFKVDISITHTKVWTCEIF